MKLPSCRSLANDGNSVSGLAMMRSLTPGGDREIEAHFAEPILAITSGLPSGTDAECRELTQRLNWARLQRVCLDLLHI
jgi:hypothetical protein